MDMIILRSSKSSQRDAVPVSTLSHLPDELSVAVEDVRTNDLFTLHADPQVIGSAPPMPMLLIRGDDASPATASMVPEVSWGIQAVGAAIPRSPARG